MIRAFQPPPPPPRQRSRARADHEWACGRGRGAGVRVWAASLSCSFVGVTELSLCGGWAAPRRHPVGDFRRECGRGFGWAGDDCLLACLFVWGRDFLAILCVICLLACLGA